MGQRRSSPHRAWLIAWNTLRVDLEPAEHQLRRQDRAEVADCLVGSVNPEDEIRSPKRGLRCELLSVLRSQAGSDKARFEAAKAEHGRWPF